MDRWDACTDAGYSPALPDKSIGLYVGVDASTKRDRAAVVSVYRDRGKVKLGPKKFWQPSASEPLDLEETMESYILELARGYRVIRLRYDPYQFHRSAITLAKKGIPVEEYPQTIPNLTEMGQGLYDLVNTGQLVLYPDKDLRHEANSAIAKETGRGLRIAKEKATQKIDQIVALAMASIGAVKTNSVFENLD
jgi:phage terminase large subunit-like protein